MTAGVLITNEVRCPDSMYAAVGLEICKACMWFKGIEDRYVQCEKAKTGRLCMECKSKMDRR